MKKQKSEIINEIIDAEQDLLYELPQPYTKKLFRTNYNSRYLPKIREKNDLPSMTLPGQSYTIHEILFRFTNGQSLNIEKQGSFTENPDFDDINLSNTTIQDLTDYDEVKTLNQSKINLLSAELDEIKTKSKVKRSISSDDDEGGGITGSKRSNDEVLSPSKSEQLRNT